MMPVTSRRVIMRSALHLAVAVLALPVALRADEKEPTAYELKLKPAVVGKDDAELLRLRKERYNAALEIVQLQLVRVESGRGNVGPVGPAIERVVVAGLELEPGPKERLALIEEAIRFAKHVEELAKLRFDAGQVPKDEVALARFIRLGAEIRLAREKERGKK